MGAKPPAQEAKRVSVKAPRVQSEQPTQIRLSFFFLTTTSITFLSFNFQLKMSKIASTSLAPCHHGDRWRVKLMQHHQQPQWQCHATTKSEKRSSSQPLMVKNQMAVKPATYSSRIATDIPLYESPGVCLPFCFNSLIFLFSFFCVCNFRWGCSLTCVYVAGFV